MNRRGSPRLPGKGGRRALLGAFDQALSSLGNFIFTIIGAAILDADSFGQIAVVFAIYLIANGLIRSVTSDVFVIGTQREADNALFGSESACVMTCLAAGVTLAIVIAMPSWAMASLREPLLTLCVFLPALALQDTLRYIAFARATPGLAVVSDAIWTVGTVSVVAVLAYLGGATAPALVAAWGATGAFAGAVAFLMMRMPLSAFKISAGWKSVREWLVEHRRLYPYFIVDSVAAQASGPLVLFLLTGISGLAAGGALRAAQLLFNPVVVLVNSVRVWAIPELVRAGGRPTRKWRIRATQLMAVLTVACTVWSAAVLVAPESLVDRLLGASADQAKPLLLPTAVMITITGGITTPAFAAIRSLGEAAWGLWARLVSALAMLVATAIGAYMSGAYGAAWGLALAMPVVAGVWLLGVYRSIGRRRRLN